MMVGLYHSQHALFPVWESIPACWPDVYPEMMDGDVHSIDFQQDEQHIIGI